MPDTEYPIHTALPPSVFEKLFAVAVLLISAGAFTNMEVTGSVVGTHNMGMEQMQIVWVLLYIITLILYFRKARQSLRNLFAEWPLIAVIALALSSILWSQDPEFTMRRAVALALTFIFGIYFGSRFSISEQLRLLVITCWVCIVFSFIFELSGFNPSQGIPGWYGMFYLKNQLGRVMVIGVLVFLFWRRVEPRHNGFASMGILASVVLLLLSQSMTSVVELVLLLALLRYLQWMLRKGTRWMVGGMAFLFATGTAAFFWMVKNLESVTAILGRNASLTGRVPLWIISIVMAVRRPWLGYGYDAFWMPGEENTIRIWRILRWEPPHAHNGFLELWLELGLLGLILFLIVFAYYLRRSIRYARERVEPTAIWPLMFLLFLFFANFTDTCFLGRNNIFFILYTATACTCAERSQASIVVNKLVMPQPNLA